MTFGPAKLLLLSPVPAPALQLSGLRRSRQLPAVCTDFSSCSTWWLRNAAPSARDMAILLGATVTSAMVGGWWWCWRESGLSAEELSHSCASSFFWKSVTLSHKYVTGTLGCDSAPWLRWPLLSACALSLLHHDSLSLAACMRPILL